MRGASLLAGAALLVLLWAAFLPPRRADAPVLPETAYREAEAIHRAASEVPGGARAARLAEARDAYRGFLRSNPAEPRWSADAAFGEASISRALGDTAAALAAFARIEADFPGERWTRLRAMKTRFDIECADDLRRRILSEFGSETEPPALRMPLRTIRRG